MDNVSLKKDNLMVRKNKMYGRLFESVIELR